MILSVLLYRSQVPPISYKENKKLTKIFSNDLKGELIQTKQIVKTKANMMLILTRFVIIFISIHIFSDFLLTILSFFHFSVILD